MYIERSDTEQSKIKILGVFPRETFIELLGEGCVDHNRCDVNASGAHPIIFIFFGRNNFRGEHTVRSSLPASAKMWTGRDTRPPFAASSDRLSPHRQRPPPHNYDETQQK